jgi:hypothetical protein
LRCDFTQPPVRLSFQANFEAHWSFAKLLIFNNKADKSVSAKCPFAALDPPNPPFYIAAPSWKGRLRQKRKNASGKPV